MKRFLILLLLIMSTSLMFSCKKAEEDNDGGDDNKPNVPPAGYVNDDVTFDIGETVSIVVPGESFAAAKNLQNELFYALGVTPNIVNESALATNELFLGRCNSPLSKTAYQILESGERASAYVIRVLVYSDGQSVALAYENCEGSVDYTELLTENVVKLFVNDFINADKAIDFEEGFSKSYSFDLLEIQAEADAARAQKAWDAILAKSDAQTVNELRAMYAMFTPKVLNWLADLYDPESGGFYYSNSGRNYEGFLPDIESTAQAIDLLRISGMFDEHGDDPARALPDWFKEKLIAFVKGLQDPNGYFYHPQWTKAMIDSKISRRSRDLTKGLALLEDLGAKPTYDVLDVKGDGLLADGTPVGFDKPILYNGITPPLSLSNKVSAVSKIVPASSATVPSNIASKEAFISYLNGRDLKKDSYTIGNDLASQAAEIKARDEYLASIGADYRLKDILQQWLFDNCYETTGHWSPYADYDGLNGFMKISAACASLGIPLKYPEAAARSAIDAITTEEYNLTVCYAYNTWFSINNIVNILNKNHPAAQAKEIIGSIQAELKERAPELIRATMEKQSIFLRDDGSFSYTENSTSSTSQGMPVAVPGMLEGDINATLICLADTCYQMFSALGYEMPPIFGKADLTSFLDRIKELGYIIKFEEEVVVESATFDDETVGSTTESLTISNSTDSTFKVIKDTRPGASKSAKVLEFNAVEGGGKRVRLPMDLSANPLSRCYVFEGEFNFESAPTGMFSTLQVGPNCYLISFAMYDGVVYLYEQTSDGANSKIVDLKTGIPLGQWFKIKVEFFYAAAADVRIKLYVNDELISVSDNFFDREGEKLDGGNPSPDSRYEGVDFFVYSYYSAKILLDNWSCYKKTDQYLPELDPDDQPKFNIDGPDRDEIIYDFESDKVGALPESVNTQGSAEVVGSDNGNKLSVNGSAILSAPVNIRTAGANATVFELDIDIATLTEGKIFDIAFAEDAVMPHDIVKYNVEIVDVDGEKFAYIYAAPTGVSDMKIDGVMIPVGETSTLRIEYYDGVRVALFYVDSNLAASCDVLCQDAKKYTVGNIILSFTSKANLSLDNVVCEKIKKNFDTATRPGIDSVIHGFENGIDVDFSGAVSLVGDSNKYVNLGASASITFPVNARSVITNLISFSADMSINATSEAAYLLSFVDEHGNTVIAFEIRVKGGVASIHEKTENNTYSDPLCTITKGKITSISILYYPLRNIAYIISGGQAIASTSLAYSEENKLLTPAFLTIEAIGGDGSLTLDNLKVETTSDTFVPRDVKDSDNSEDKSEIITYEGSSNGNIPSSVTTKLLSSGSGYAVRELLKKDAYTKVLEFNTRPGRQDALNFALTETAKDYNATVFETDFKFTFKNGKVTSFQIFLEDGDKTAYIINLSQSGNDISFSELSTLDEVRLRGSNKTIEGAQEWHNLRIEYYNGTRDTVRIKTYIDGVLVKVSNIFGGSEIEENQPQSLITQVRFMSYGDTYADLFIDNTSFIQTNLECKDDPLTDAINPEDIPDPEEPNPENPTPDPKPEEPNPEEPTPDPEEPEEPENDPLDFESDTVGELPERVTSNKNDAYSYISVVEDPHKAANKVLKFYKANTKPDDNTYTKSWPMVTIPRTGTAKDHNVTVFEADFYIQYIEGRLDTTYTFYLGAKAAPAYAFRMNFTTERFNFIDSSNDTSGISSPTIATASTTGQWFNLRIEFFEGDQNTAKIMVYMDNALIYVSRNFYGPMSTDTAGKKYTVNNDISEFRISTWGDTQGVMLIDNASLYETTLKYPTNPVGIPSGKVYPDAETEDFDAKVLPIKGGANGIITLNTDISADKQTITVLDRVISKYDLKADIAVVVDNLMENAGVGTNTEEKTPNADIINFLKAKLAGGRLKIMNHGLTHVFWADTETGENIDWDFFYREFIGSKYLLRELFPGQDVKTFVIPGYAWLVDQFGEQIYDEVYEALKDEYVASRYYGGTAANLYDWAWEKTPAHQILPNNDAQTYAVIDSIARGDGRFANLFLYHLDEDKNFDNGTTNGGTETYFYQRESRLDAICNKISSYVETGAIWQTNYEDAMLYLREVENATLTITRGENITLVLEDGLNDEIYNYPLTVRVQLDESYEAIKITQDGKVSYAIVRMQNGIYFADCDVVPNSSETVIEKVSLEDVPEEFLPATPENGNGGSMDFGGTNKDDSAWTD